MATTTTVDVSTALISATSIAYIRPIRLLIKCTLMRPNTQVYSLFDGVDVARYMTQINGANASSPILGAPIISDANGEVVAYFDVPGMTFTTGTKKFEFNELPPGSVVVTGQTTGSATAEFVSTGIHKLFQTTQTTTNTTTVTQVVTQEVHVPWTPPPPRCDPIAETFFTFGNPDGLFITSLDLFFHTKDTTQPVWVEIRETLAGVPIDTLVAPHAICYVAGTDVAVSDNALTPTNFKFKKLVYLEPNKDYCFVVQARSNKYTLWTSKMGETSKETGRIVFDQPYSGSMLLSENNNTWTPSQMEDVKFTLYKAKFNSAVGGSLEFDLKANPLIVPTSSFFTFYTGAEGDTNGGYVYVQFTFKHGLQVGDKIRMAADPLGVYNGVSGAILNGNDGTGSSDPLSKTANFTVTDVPSENIIGFRVTHKVKTGAIWNDTTVAFNNSDYITTGGRITDIQVTNGGSGYSSSSPPSVIIPAPTSGIQATAHAKVTNGIITDIIIDNPGTGYFGNPPSITISGSGGGAATAFNNDQFTVYTNRVYHLSNPSISSFTPTNTQMGASLATTNAAYDDGTLTQYDAGKTYPLNLNGVTEFDSNLLLASADNEAAHLSGASAAKMMVTMNTDNPDVSPIIDLKASKMYFANYLVNNQHPQGAPSAEVLSSTNIRGSVASITMTPGMLGTGYSTAPTVEFTGTGTGATAHCTVSGGAITSLVLDTPGSGYVVPPRIRFVGGGGTGAAATATITPYNSELGVDTGSARGRYLTNQTQLATVSTGVQVFATAYSNQSSSFEVYVRTSLSSTGVDHKLQTWQLLTCDTARNLSGNPGDYREYKFYANGLSPFDVFSLKIVMRTTTPWQPPIIREYRAIVVA